MLKVILAVMLIGTPAFGQSPGRAFVDLSAAQVASVHAAVAARLREPETATFRQLLAASDSAMEGMIWICGMVSGRNGFGGMADETPFFGSLVTENSGSETFVLISLAGQNAAEQARVLDACLARMPPR